MSKIGEDRLGSSGDDFYAALMDAHDGLSFEESARINARLVLLLANEVGDLARIQAAIAAAQDLGPDGQSGAPPR